MGSAVQAVLEQIPPAGRGENCSMGWSKIFLLASLAFSASFAARQLRGNGRYGQRRRVAEVEESQEPRDERSLVNTFPFNARNDHGDHHVHHNHEHHAEPQQFQNLEPIDARQRNRNRNRNPPPRGGGGGGDSQAVSFNEVSAAGPDRDGKRCIDKVEMIEETEYDDVECNKVHEEKCEDETSAYTPNTKCSKWPKEVCSVSKKQVKKYNPITGCTKEPRELCAPAGCGFKQGPEECYDKTQTVVQDAPKEQCTLEPQRTCKHVTKLVPKLEPTEECVDVPKEVC